nr:uncharacterized mitochondrial protein AtMg00810-like [Tanacetum cinerariifolium]
VKQKKDGIFISQDKYVAEILKKFRLTEGKSASTPIDTEKPLLKEPDANDVTRLQALVDMKKILITEAAIRDILRLDDAEGVDCLPNEEIFAELARMGYEKPSTKLTFYKAFFSSQWKANPADDVQDQSIQSPTPPTPPPQQDIPSTSQEALDSCTALTRRVENLEHDKVAQDLEIIKLKTRVKKLEKANKVKALKLRRLRKVGTSQRIESFADTDIEDASNQGRMIAEWDRDTGVALMDDEGTKKKVEDAQVADDEQVVTAASTPVCAASIIIPAAELKVPAATITAVPVRVDKEDPYVQRYQVMKKRPQTKAQARRNMIMYLKNTVGFRLDYFKGMSYDDIRLIFEAKFNSNIEFLLKSNEQIEEEENRALESINETPAQKAAKRRKLNEEVKDVKDLKQHLEIVPISYT